MSLIAASDNFKVPEMLRAALTQAVVARQYRGDIAEGIVAGMMRFDNKDIVHTLNDKLLLDKGIEGVISRMSSTEEYEEPPDWTGDKS